MKIKKIYITLLKKKNFNSIYPRPSYFKKGMIFIKLISDTNHEGYGEVSPYIADPKKICLLIEKNYKKYFRGKDIGLNFVYNLKKKINNLIFQSIISILIKQYTTSLQNSKKLPYQKS